MWDETWRAQTASRFSLGRNWSAAVAAFDRFWRGSAEMCDSVLAGWDVNTFYI